MEQEGVASAMPQKTIENISPGDSPGSFFSPSFIDIGV
jgi:hypothetical protein